jgi:hypothetical protein
MTNDEIRMTKPRADAARSQWFLVAGAFVSSFVLRISSLFRGFEFRHSNFRLSEEFLMRIPGHAAAQSPLSSHMVNLNNCGKRYFRWKSLSAFPYDVCCVKSIDWTPKDFQHG